MTFVNKPDILEAILMRTMENELKWWVPPFFAPLRDGEQAQGEDCFTFLSVMQISHDDQRCPRCFWNDSFVRHHATI